MKRFSIKNYIGSVRGLLIALFDLVCVTAAYYLAVVFGNFSEMVSNRKPEAEVFFAATKILPLFLALFFVSCFFLRIYRVMWRYAGAKAYVKLALCCVFSVLVFGMIDWFGVKLLRLLPVYAFLMVTIIVFCAFTRMAYAITFTRAKKSVRTHEARKRAMIIGAGYTTKTIIDELLRDKSPYQPICLIDDDPEKRGRDICGVPVVGSTQEIPKYARQHNIEVILFAIPTITSEARKMILRDCVATDCEVKVLPFVGEMIKNTDVLGQVQQIEIADLLGREPIKFNDGRILKYICGKVCCVTGGGGSIGSELCRQIARFDPKKLIILDVYENSTYDIQQELLREHGSKLDLSVEIASVTDFAKMEDFYKTFKPEIIFHAAAHKHVPLMETNPEEAVKNNVFGTYNMALLADKYGAQKFIMVSTDKAVNPTNIMGATKRMCEMVVQYVAERSKGTEFAAVRFGNVLGSNGSVIPLFKRQIAEGGPVTVTHRDITRFFMMIPEAVSLVLQAGAFAKGGEIFVLDMGESVKILELAENLIRMLGKRPYEDIQIEFTGLRPGEKLYEELLRDEEKDKKTDNDKIFIGKQTPIDYTTFETDLNELRAAAESNDKARVFLKMQELVPTYKPKSPK